MPKRFAVLLISIFLISAATVFAEDIQATANFDKRTVGLNEEVRLSIKVTGAQGNIQAPRLPAFQGFDTFYTGRASHLTFVNNQSSSMIEFSYVLVPKTPGKYNLGPIDVIVNGRNFRTEAVEIEVTPGTGTASSQTRPGGQGSFAPSSSSPSGQKPLNTTPRAYTPPPTTAQHTDDEPPPTFKPEDDNIFVRAWVESTPVVYPNQQILLTYSLYTRYDTRYEGFQDEPEISGFWIEEFPMEKDIARDTVQLNGKKYIKADIKKVALFPQTPAEYTINPGTIKASVRIEPQQTSVFDEFFNDSFFSGGSFFSRRENRLIKPAPIQISVKPFPEQGKPESFQGAVGNFRLTATVDKTSVKQNEPVTMKMLIEGEGNIETLSKPKVPELPGFKIYESDTSSQLFKTGNVIGGKKSIEVVFIPTKSGEMTIPKLELSFFNPTIQSYGKVFTPEFKLNVIPSEEKSQLPKELVQQDALKKKIEVESQDIRFIREALADVAMLEFRDRVFRGLFVLNVFLLFMLGLGFYRKRRHQIFSSDHALKRRSHARAVADARLRKLKKPRKNAEHEELNRYFEEVDKILTQYLADKFNLSAYGITRSAIEVKLSEKLGEADSLFKEIMDLYAICDESRFGRGGVVQETAEKATRILKDALGRLERIK